MPKPETFIIGSESIRETVIIKELPSYPKEVWVEMYKSISTGEKRAIMNNHPDRKSSDDKLTDAAIAMLVPTIKAWSFGEMVEVDDGNGGKKEEAQTLEINETNLDKIDSETVALLIFIVSGQVDIESDGSWKIKEAEKKS